MNGSAHNFSCKGLRLQEAQIFPGSQPPPARPAPSPLTFLPPYLPGSASQVQVQPVSPGNFGAQPVHLFPAPHRRGPSPRGS